MPAEGADRDAAALTLSAKGLESNRLHLNYTVALLKGLPRSMVCLEISLLLPDAASAVEKA